MLSSLARQIRQPSSGWGSPLGEFYTEFARTFISIPVIDIEALVDPDSTISYRQKTAAELNHACTDVGFFYVKNHGVPEALCTGVLKSARRWFSLPKNVKNQLEIGPGTHYRGYQMLGANVTRYDDGFQRDWHEAIDLYYEVDPEDRKGLQKSPLHGHNQWPSQDPEFDDTLKKYISAMNVTGQRVMSGIAQGLNLPPTFFDDANIGDPYWVTRVIHYPPLLANTKKADQPGPEDALSGAEVPRSTQLSCGEHTDYGLLTLVNQESEMGALQVKNASGDWITADPIPGTFVCNIGDMMQVWTNGLYTPTLHRVVNPDSHKSRVSIPYFYEPGFDTIVRPQLGLHGSTSGALYQPTRYGSHLEGKVLSNFEL